MPSKLLKPRTRKLLPQPDKKWIQIVGLLCIIIFLILIIRFVFKEKDNKQQKKPRPNPSFLQSRQTTTTNSPKNTTTQSPYQYAYMNPANMEGCYSMRLVVPTYNGPVIKIEKNDGTQQDLYTDETQSFLTIDPDNQSLSLSDWLGSGAGKVRVWYDQSGNGNNALCYSYCPTISTLNSSKYVLSFQQYTDNGLIINPVKPYSIFFQFWHDSNDPAKIISTDVDSSIDRYYGIIIQNGDINGNNSEYDWYYVGKGNKDFTVNQEDSSDYDLSTWNTVCLSIENPDYSDDKENLNLIGKDVSGYMSELILFNRPMTQNEIDDYNNNKFLVEK
jgi:hypothetical protein